MPDEKAPGSGAFLPASLMYFCSGQPMHFCPGVDTLSMRWARGASVSSFFSQRPLRPGCCIIPTAKVIELDEEPILRTHQGEDLPTATSDRLDCLTAVGSLSAR